MTHGTHVTHDTHDTAQAACGSSPSRARRLFGRVALALLAGLLACGPDLLDDPSFELWCGAKLCKPWVSSGEIERVPTWHARDYGVSLGKDATISQLSSADRVDCIELSIIADVVASAEVWLELDFLDDGKVDYRQLIPASDWANLRFRVAAPSWYDVVRFRVRKEGDGPAVVAQLRAQGAGECESEPIELLDRRVGTPCEEDRECASGVCNSSFGSLLEVCGASDEACEFLEAWFAAKVCGECGDDDECLEGEVCGIDTTGERPTRACEAAASAPLGELCTRDGECASGRCCFGACSECCPDGAGLDEAACGEDVVCGNAAFEAALAEFEASASDEAAASSEVDADFAAAWLCNAGAGARALGEPCATSADCASNECELPAVECIAACDDLCRFFSADTGEQDACGYARRLAGACR